MYCVHSFLTLSGPSSGCYLRDHWSWMGIFSYMVLSSILPALGRLFPVTAEESVLVIDQNIKLPCSENILGVWGNNSQNGSKVCFSFFLAHQQPGDNVLLSYFRETMEIIVKIPLIILSQISQSTFVQDFIVYKFLQPSDPSETSIWEKMHAEPDLDSSPGSVPNYLCDLG